MIEPLFARFGFIRYTGKKLVPFCAIMTCFSLLSCSTLPRNNDLKEPSASVQKVETTDTNIPGATVPVLTSGPSVSGEADSKTASASDGSYSNTGRIVQEGIAVELSMAPVVSKEKASEEIMEGEDVTVQFRITDTATGTPVTNLKPAAWIQPSSEADCTKKVQAILSRGLASRAEIDLNAFYVLSLNDNASISVVDPLFNYGGSNLLTTVLLKDPGEDWVLSKNRERLFVSMPYANQVAVIDTTTWKVITNIDTGKRPIRLALQPDGKYLWVGCNGIDTLDPTSGVTIIDPAELIQITHIPTGFGHHEIALAENDHYAFVTNRDSGTVSVIDVWNLNKIKDIESGKQPASVAYSSLSKSAYVVSEGDGTILVIDGQSLEMATRIDAKPGLGIIRFPSGRRFGFVVNSRENVVHVIDDSTHRIIQTGGAGEEPDQITFTGNTAYIRSRGSEQILMIPLDQVGHEGGPIPVTSFSGGQFPFNKAQSLSIADGIVPAPGGGAVLVANPADTTIYYYKEGMAAPMGNFKNFGRQPRAVLVVDRSLTETKPGVYATTIRLTLGGNLDVAFFMDSPRIVHCFAIKVKQNPNIVKTNEQLPVKVEPLSEMKTLYAGESVQLLFKVTDLKTHQPRAGLKDFGVMAFTTGNWHNQQWATSVDDGIYEIRFTPPKSGVYYLSFQCPSLDVRLNQLPPLILKITNKG